MRNDDNNIEDFSQKLREFLVNDLRPVKRQSAGALGAFFVVAYVLLAILLKITFLTWTDTLTLICVFAASLFCSVGFFKIPNQEKLWSWEKMFAVLFLVFAFASHSYFGMAGDHLDVSEISLFIASTSISGLLAVFLAFLWAKGQPFHLRSRLAPFALLSSLFAISTL